MMTFGQYAALRRQQAGLSQSQVAQALGYTHRAHISKMERGIVAWSLDDVVKLAGVLNMSISYLIEGWENETNT